MNISRSFGVFAVGLSLSIAACSGDAVTDGKVATPPPAATPSTQADAQPTGNVIEVRMVTEGNANYFEPAEVTAQPGDVVRFVLVSGLHNVSFPVSQNPGAAGLPASSPFLQSPGQTFDVPVTMRPGTYEFQCDPHAMMGMIGTLTVN